MHPYSSIDTTAAWKKLRFIISVRPDFHMIDCLSIAVYAFVSRVSMSFFGCIAVIQLYRYTYGNIINNNDERKHSLAKYTSHTLLEMVAKGLCVTGELETEQTATYWPPVPFSLSTLLSRSSELLNRGSWGSIALCWVLDLYTASYLQLTDSNLWISCRTGLYHCLTSTCFPRASHLHPVQSVHSQR